MIKYFVTIALLATTTFAGVVGGVSMTVDSKPITLYEIQSYVQQFKVPKEEAVNRLIQKKIEDIEIQKQGIVASPYAIDKKVEVLAQQNKMSLEDFKKALVSEGHTEREIRAQIEEQLTRDELYKRIVGGKLKKPDEEELRSYYDLHQGEFKLPSVVEVVEFLSPSKEALAMQQKQPMARIPNIKVSQKKINLKEIDPKLAQLLMSTPDGSFTPVLNLGKFAGMFYMQKKIDGGKVSYETAKNAIVARVFKSKEQAALIEYFEKKKSEANIKIVRRPN